MRRLALLLVLLVPLASANEPPIASYSIDPAIPALGDVVQFNSTSTDSDGTIASWEWDFGDGVTAQGKTVTHTYTEAGTYSIVLTVTDDDGATNASVPFSVQIAAPPQAPATVSGPNTAFGLLPIFVALLLFVVAFMVLSKGQPDPYNRVFASFYIVSGIKSLTEGVIVLFGDLAVVDAWGVRVNAIAAYILIPLFLWFVMIFPRPIASWLHNGSRGAFVMVLAVPFLAAEFGYIPALQDVNIFNIYSSILAIFALGLLVYHAWELDSDEERKRVRLLSVTFVLLVFATVNITVLNVLHSNASNAGDAVAAAKYLRWTGIYGLIVNPLLEIVGATILMYAILRYQLLGIERTVMRITRAGLFAILVPGTFVIVANSIEELFQSTVLSGIRYDFIIAGFVAAFLLLPLQKGTGYLAKRWFPTAEEASPQYVSARRMEIFEAQLRYCLRDGRIGRAEIPVLTKLRETLGLRQNELMMVMRKFPGVSPAQFMQPADRPRGPPRRPPGPPPTKVVVRPPPAPSKPVQGKPL